MSQPPLPEPPDSDATIMIPRPGGRRTGSAAPVNEVPPPRRDDNGDTGDTRTQAPPSRGGEAASADLVGTNPLLAQASPLLNAVSTIRKTLAHRNASGLREDLLRAVADFERGARQANCKADQIQIARYCLCTMLDEAVSLMPWGEVSGWSQRSLLVTLHHETFGGEKFFQYLDNALDSPRRDLDLLELLYACLALGFEGKFHVIDNGRSQLDALRDRVHAAIRRERGETERDLSGHWHGVERAPKPLVRRVPPWLVLGGVGLLLFLVFVTYTMLLASKSDPVFAALAAVRADPGKYEPPVVANTPPPPPAPPPPRLRRFWPPTSRPARSKSPRTGRSAMWCCAATTSSTLAKARSRAIWSRSSAASPRRWTRCLARLWSQGTPTTRRSAPCASRPTSSCRWNARAASPT